MSSQERWFIADESGSMVFASSVFSSSEDALASASILLGELGWSINQIPPAAGRSAAVGERYGAETFVNGAKATQEGETLDQLVARIRSWETERTRWGH